MSIRNFIRRWLFPTDQEKMAKLIKDEIKEVDEVADGVTYVGDIVVTDEVAQKAKAKLTGAPYTVRRVDGRAIIHRKLDGASFKYEDFYSEDDADAEAIKQLEDALQELKNKAKKQSEV